MNSINYFVIEFPGYSDDPQKLIKVCGGLKKIIPSLSQTHFELYLRPRPLSVPIFGDVISTANIYLKIIKKTHKRTGEIKLEYKIMGFITKTIRFRSIADFQSLPNESNHIVQLYKNLYEWNDEELDKFRFSFEKGLVDPLGMLPPPAFSSIQWHVPYQYKQNSAVLKVMVESKVQFVTKKPAPKMILKSFKLSSKAGNVPDSPPEDLDTSDVPQIALDKIKQLYQERPIWSRTAIVNHIDKAHVRLLKTLLPAVAYLMPKGPWRDCWVRYGYDPRMHVESSQFQAILLRGESKRVLARGKRIREVKPTPQEYRKSHIFDGKTQISIHSFLLCDVIDPDIVQFIQRVAKMRSRYSKVTGWYSKKLIDAIRSMMVRKINIVNGSVDEDDSDVDWNDFVDESQDEQESSDDTEKETEYTEVIAEESSSKSAIQSKVDELMKNIQLPQQEEQDMENDMDEYDVFGDEDESD